MDVAIIGAGIGGLTTALALKRRNIPFRVYEAAEELKPVGTGIILGINAMQVYHQLQIENKILQIGKKIDSINVTDFKLIPITETLLLPFEQKYGHRSVAIHRADLHHILINEVGEENIILNSRLSNAVQLNNNDYELTFENNKKAIHPFVIGADGIHSKIRQTFFPGTRLRDAEQICFRGVTSFNLPPLYKNELIEGWGKGKRFGFVEISEGTVYWYFLVNNALYKKQSDLNLYLKDAPDFIRQMILSTPEEKWFTANLHDLQPITEWQKDRIILLGDAAHATTPNMGQGACQAIEDAYVLFRLLEKNNPEDAFKNYPLIRCGKAHHVVNTSWKIGKIAQLENKLLIYLRNIMLRSTPKATQTKNFDRLFTLDNV
ncbi:FAD-dependent monooxygenase [Elizabethkingia meningoseptica]|uniref:FAD-dependent monooxygenase n=1 Tax=Elizabethkingia meningoseptica TaxID=238 RepID=UPI0020110C88|nr:FAD-dependent monooxygenase [Elizabethkingia meningoseptica]MCL1675517.1 FAD-dependent monooxygenase [Elizabethkingia meningoseptica]MCL1687067.1 FAD-dependent monooxygenase [Elizabethkingia meningoseptica]MDE5490725.1 FAD-dependent monooxygenase [Elizabethkingia meningoseptica]